MYNNLLKEFNIEELSSIRKRIYDTDKKRNLLLQKLLKTKAFITAQVYDRFKTCGNENCKCRNGQPHGPFLWIYQNKKNKPILSTTVADDKKDEAKELAERYKVLLEQRQKLRELESDINTYLNAMEKILEKEANEYVTKRHPGRPKKVGEAMRNKKVNIAVAFNFPDLPRYIKFLEESGVTDDLANKPVDKKRKCFEHMEVFTLLYLSKFLMGIKSTRGTSELLSNKATLTLLGFAENEMENGLNKSGSANQYGDGHERKSKIFT